MRHFTDPGAIEHVAAVWGIDPADMPGPGEPIFKQLERMEAGEIRGLINICANPMLSWPDQARERRILDGHAPYVVIDIFLSDSALLSAVLLPGSAWTESGGGLATRQQLLCTSNKAPTTTAKAQPR